MKTVVSVHTVDLLAAIDAAVTVAVASFVSGISVTISKTEARDFCAMFKPNQRWSLWRSPGGDLHIGGQRHMHTELTEDHLDDQENDRDTTRA